MNDMINTIQLGDCYELIKKIPDNSIDLILTDPPYGINMDKGAGGYGCKKQLVKKYSDDWDKTTPSKEIFTEMLRIGKKVIIFGGNYFTDKLPKSQQWLVWDKVGEIKFHNPFSDCELMWTNLPGKSVKKYLVKQQGFINDGDERCHPTQKPLRLISNIIKDYTNENDIVLDCFCGSGTTCVAAKELGRRFIGMEINEKYYKIAVDRLNGINANGQTSIFTDFDKME